MKRAFLILTVVASLAAPASAATKYPNCAALQKQYPYGVAKSATAAKTATGLTGKPKVSAALYKANASKDRDRDGVACES